MITRNANPPKTPPTIAPVGVLRGALVESLDAGEDGLGVVVSVGGGSRGVPRRLRFPKFRMKHHQIYSSVMEFETQG